MNNNRRVLGLARASVVGVVLVCAALVPPAEASATVPMNLATLADLAGQVIVGRVVSVRSYWAEDPRRIETEVVFEQVDYFKGRLPGSGASFALVVPGGTVGQMTLRIADAPAFAAGEKWILFLLPEYKTYPVAGIWQGAFRVEADAAGVERVYDAARRPISGFDADGSAQMMPRDAHAALRRLVAAEHLRLRSACVPPEGLPAISYVDFQELVRPVLARSTDHQLTTPAGRPVPVALRPVPLLPAVEAAMGAVNRRDGR